MTDALVSETLPAGQAAMSLKAVSLADGVLKAMFLTKVKIGAAILLTLAAVGGGGMVLTYRAGSAHDPIAAAPAAAEQAHEKEVSPDVLLGVGKRVEDHLAKALKEIEGMDDWTTKAG